jgi:hypothetical protein
VQLSKGTMRYLADEFKDWVTNTEITEICDKMNIEGELSGGFGKKDRFNNLMDALNDSDKLAQLISILFLEYDNRNSLDNLNTILRRDGYTISEEGQIISSIGEIVELKNKLSDIENGLSEISGETLLNEFKHGVENYGDGKNFQDIRNALEGVINTILTNKNETITHVDMRRKMELLLNHNILKSSSEKFRVSGNDFEFEHLHSYGIWKMLSHYIDHHNEMTGENERHFVFFQSIGLIWLLIKRNKETL